MPKHGLSNNVVLFPQVRSVIAVSPEQKPLVEAGQIVTMEMQSDELASEGIHPGDRLIVRKTFLRREITSSNICIVVINDEVSPRRVVLNGNGTATLISCSRDGQGTQLNESAFEIRGIVTGFHRSFE